jgi:hypothetical protein
VPLLGITNRGLLTIAVLVSILWGCILAERAIVRRAYEETRHALRNTRHTIPAKADGATPRPQRPAPAAPFV